MLYEVITALGGGQTIEQIGIALLQRFARREDALVAGRQAALRAGNGTHAQQDKQDKRAAANEKAQGEALRPGAGCAKLV